MPYLTREAATKTLALAGRTGGNEIVFDYANPPVDLDEEQRAYREASAARVAAIGEPWTLYFDTEDLHRLLGDCGFTVIEDLGPAAMVDRYLGVPGDPSRRGAHLAHATR